MRWSRRAALALAVVAMSCGGVALAQSRSGPLSLQPKDAAAARHIRLQRAVYGLINRATAHVAATRPGCSPTPRRRSSGVTHDRPTQAVLDALAPLRRPATAAEQQARTPGAAFGGQVYADFVRNLVTADGTSLTLMVARQIPVVYRPSASCLDAQHAWLVRLLTGRPPTLRTDTLNVFAAIRHDLEHSPKPPTTPQDGIYLFMRGGGGGGAGIADFLDRGTFISTGAATAAAGHPNRSRVLGLVPDGVASVTLEYPRTVNRGRDYKPTVYPSAVSRTVAVRDNALAVTVPRPAPDAFPRRMVWRNATGDVVHVSVEPGR